MDGEKSFTDDDLKRVKEEFEPYGEGDPRILTGSDWLGLIARLEAAELCSESLDDLLHHGIKYPNGAVHEADPDLAKERLEVWRKAAGTYNG
jgi:hypothetical protein